MIGVCMRLATQIFSFVGWLAGTTIAFVSDYVDFFDKHMKMLAAIVGFISGIIWLLTLIVRRKKEKIELEIKQIELEKLKNEIL